MSHFEEGASEKEKARRKTRANRTQFFPYYLYTYIEQRGDAAEATTKTKKNA